MQDGNNCEAVASNLSDSSVLEWHSDVSGDVFSSRESFLNCLHGIHQEIDSNMIDVLNARSKSLSPKTGPHCVAKRVLAVKTICKTWQGLSLDGELMNQVWQGHMLDDSGLCTVNLSFKWVADFVPIDMHDYFCWC